jgi:hypothetical protein
MAYVIGKHDRSFTGSLNEMPYRMQAMYGPFILAFCSPNCVDMYCKDQAGPRKKVLRNIDENTPLPPAWEHAGTTTSSSSRPVTLTAATKKRFEFMRNYLEGRSAGVVRRRMGVDCRKKYGLSKDFVSEVGMWLSDADHMIPYGLHLEEADREVIKGLLADEVLNG